MIRRLLVALRTVARTLLISILIILLPTVSTIAYADANIESKAIYGDHTMYQDVVACDVGKKNSNVPAALTGLRDQIGQMMIPLVTSEAQANDAVSTYHVGGFFVNTPFFDGAKINAAKSKFSPTPFVGLDQEGGQVDRLKLGTPSAKAMGGMSVDQVKKLGTDTATKIKEIGGTFDAAPVVDIDSPNSPAIGNIQRAFSNNPDVIAEKAGAYAEGLKAGGITPVYKHFPGIGRTTVNSDQVAGSSPSLDELKGLDLKPYQTLLANNTTGAWVMVGNYSVPGLTNGVPASKSKATYDLLKNEYQFNGIIITDDLAAGGLGGPGALADSALEAIKSGADIALFTGEDQLKAIIDKVEQAANADPALKTQIEASSAKITAAKANMGNDSATKSGNGGGCTCGGSGGTSSTTLVGGENAEKIFNFFIGKGFAPAVAGGFIGNMTEESGLNPRALEPGTTGDATIDGRGYGLIQWSFHDRQDPLNKMASDQGKPVSDLGLQLDYIMWELQNKYKPLLERIQKIDAETPNPGEDIIDKATQLIEIYYETHRGIIVNNKGPTPETKPPQEFHKTRVDAAHAAVAKFGSGMPVAGNGSGGGGGGCSQGGQQGPTGGTFSWPEKIEKSYITQCFGGPGGHPGIDISNSGPPSETPIFAAADGVVVKAGPAGGYGPNFVVIKHESIKFGTSYGHMNSMMVHEGDQVKQGQQIGEQGSLGISTGPHLHFNTFPGDYSGWDHANVDPFKNGLTVPPGVSNPNGCGG